MPSGHLPLKLTDLVLSGEPVDLHFVHGCGSGEHILKAVVVTHVGKTWVGVTYKRRGIVHELNVACSAVFYVDRRSRPRGRGSVWLARQVTRKRKAAFRTPARYLPQPGWSAPVRPLWRLMGQGSVGRRTGFDGRAAGVVDPQVRRALQGWRTERAQGNYATVDRSERDEAAAAVVRFVEGGK